MKKYVAFRIPDMGWEGIDWVYQLRESKKNDLDFFIISATTIQKAKIKYFNDFYYPKYIKTDTAYSQEYEYAGESACFLCESFDESKVLKMYGATDGPILWSISCDFADSHPAGSNDKYDSSEFIDKRIFQISKDTIRKLCFDLLDGDIAVSEISGEI